MTVNQLSKNEHDLYYSRYIEKLNPNLHLRDGFKIGKDSVIDFFKSIPLEKLEYRYETGKWTIKEVLQHLIDTERIFMYRCFRIARGDTTALAGFDQNLYINPSKANKKTRAQLMEEFTITRMASILFLKSVSDEDLGSIGTANLGAMSAMSAAFTIIGHEVWHMDIITERYL